MSPKVLIKNLKGTYTMQLCFITNKKKCHNNTKSNKRKDAPTSTDDKTINSTDDKTINIIENKKVPVIIENKKPKQKHYFNCRHCKIGFTNPYNLQKHVEISCKTLHKQAKKNYQCDKCGHKFTRASYLKVHLANEKCKIFIKK